MAGAMKKKAEAERAIRHLATEWFLMLPADKREHPSFVEFKSWLRANGHAGFLLFRSVMGSDEDAERWFDEELGQNWRR